jgi:hypothetical protein
VVEDDPGGKYMSTLFRKLRSSPDAASVAHASRPEPALTAYEQQRLANMRRNAEQLDALKIQGECER